MNAVSPIERNTSPENKGMFRNAMEKTCWPILVVLHITGLHNLPTPDGCRQCNMGNYFWTWPKYIFNAVLGINGTFWLLVMTMAARKSFSGACFVFIVSLSYGHNSLYKERSQIGSLLQRMSDVGKTLRVKYNFKLLSLFVLFFSFYSYFCLISMMFLLTIDGATDEPLEDAVSFFGLVNVPMDIFETLQRVFLNVQLAIIALWATPIVTYYIFLCICLHQAFKELTVQLQEAKDTEEFSRLLAVYGEATNIIRALDKHFSYSIFVLIVSYMGDLFWLSHNSVFLSQEDIFTVQFWVNFSFLLLQLLTVVYPASYALKSVKFARIEINRWLGKLGPQDKKIRTVAKSYSRRVFSLTIWDIYPFDKSMVVSCLGTLVSYGFLAANLRSVRNRKAE